MSDGNGKFIRLALTEEQLKALAEMKDTIEVDRHKGKPGILFGKIDVHNERIEALWWPSEAAQLLLGYMDLLMSFYKIQNVPFKMHIRRSSKEQKK
jgi:hypothetical protein